MEPPLPPSSSNFEPINPYTAKPGLLPGFVVSNPHRSMPPRPKSLRSNASSTRRFIASVVGEDPIPPNPLDAPEAALGFWNSVIACQPDHERDKESLVVILLTTRLRPFAWHRVSVGTLTETTAHPREILRPVLLGAAYGFVLVHNHPSGDPSPSAQDRRITEKIAEAAELMQLRFVDHVIVAETQRVRPGGEACFSFRAAGLC